MRLRVKEPRKNRQATWLNQACWEEVSRRHKAHRDDVFDAEPPICPLPLYALEDYPNASK